VTRVLYLAVSGERVGGAEAQYEYLLEDLDRTRFAPLLLTPSRGGFSERVARGGIATQVFAYPPWRRRTWLTRRGARARLVAVAREQAIALVHADFNLGPYAVAIAAALDVPAVLHVRRPLQPAWIARYGLRRASAVIAIGRRYARQLCAGGVAAERIAIIEDATDAARFAPRGDAPLRREWPALAGRVLCGLVGRIEPFKRQLDFLRASAPVVRAGHPLACVVAGAPNRDWPRYVRNVHAWPNRYGAGVPVVFTGARTDIEAVIGSLDVLVTLSGGSVMLEAMASGVPVITATDSRPADLAMVRDGEAGLVVPADDAGALSAALARLCDDAPLRRALGARGRAHAVQRYSRARLARDTERLYDAVMHGDRTPATIAPATG